MDRKMKSGQWTKKLGRSLAAALAFAGGAGVCLPVTAWAAALTGVESEVTSTTNDVDAVSQNVSGGSLTVAEAYDVAMGGYSGADTYDYADANAQSGNASNNTLTLSPGSENSSSKTCAYGGCSSASIQFGDWVKSGNASGNTVNISGGSHINVYGGYSEAWGDWTGSTVKATSGDASNNTINISGSPIITGDVYGGYTLAHARTAGTAVSGDASDNVINISGTPDLSAASLYGGCSSAVGKSGSSTEGETTGNTLNIYTSAITVKSIACFQNINFYIPATVVSGDTLLTIVGGTATDLTGVTIEAGVMGGSALAVGDTVTLLTNASGLTTDSTTTYGTLSAGVSQDYTLSIAESADSTSLVATITSGGGLKEQTKSLVETQMGTLSLLTGGMDMLAGPGLANAASAVAANVNAPAADSGTGSSGGAATAAATAGSGTNAAAGTASGESPDQPKADAASRGQQTNAAAAARTMTPFAAMGGNALRQHSGSYVDVRGVNLSLGFAKEVRNAQGTLLFGPILEYGKGSYTSHLDDGTRGDGNTHYVGGGIFARETQPNGFYYEGSLRAGCTTADYRSTDLSGSTGSSDGSVRYDTSAAYWSLHLGLGRVVTLAGGSTLDLYGKYFHAHTGSDNVTLSSGEAYHFDAVDSNRVRFGGRYTHPVSAASSIYAGLAYQYEFSGDARAHYNGMTTASPSVKGGSGMLELGWQMKPGVRSPLTIDLGITGWAGRQEGVTFQAGLQWVW